MTEYNEGDLVEGVKGESVVRGRLDNIGNLIIDGLDWRVAGLIRNGFTIRVVEAAPVVVLPTEPGIYEGSNFPTKNGYSPYRLTSDGRWRHLGTGVIMGPMQEAGTLTRLEAVSETAKKVLDRIRKDSNGDGGYFDHQYTARQLRELFADFGVEL